MPEPDVVAALDQARAELVALEGRIADPDQPTPGRAERRAVNDAFKAAEAAHDTQLTDERRAEMRANGVDHGPHQGITFGEGVTTNGHGLPVDHPAAVAQARGDEGNG